MHPSPNHPSLDLAALAFPAQLIPSDGTARFPYPRTCCRPGSSKRGMMASVGATFGSAPAELPSCSPQARPAGDGDDEDLAGPDSEHLSIRPVTLTCAVVPVFPSAQGVAAEAEAALAARLDAAAPSCPPDDDGTSSAEPGVAPPGPAAAPADGAADPTDPAVQSALRALGDINGRMAPAWNDDVALVKCFSDGILALNGLSEPQRRAVAEEVVASLLVMKAAEAIRRFSENPTVRDWACVFLHWLLVSNPFPPRVRNAAMAAGMSAALAGAVGLALPPADVWICATAWLSELSSLLCQHGGGDGAAAAAKDTEQLEQAEEQLRSLSHSLLRAAASDPANVPEGMLAGESAVLDVFDCLCATLHTESHRTEAFRAACRDGQLLEEAVRAFGLFAGDCKTTVYGCEAIRCIVGTNRAAAARAGAAGLIPVAFESLGQHRGDSAAVFSALKALRACLSHDLVACVQGAAISGAVELIVELLGAAEAPPLTADKHGLRLDEDQRIAAKIGACFVLTPLCWHSPPARARAGAAGAVEMVVRFLRDAQDPGRFLPANPDVHGRDMQRHAIAAMHALVVNSPANCRRAKAEGADDAVAAIAAATTDPVVVAEAEKALAAILKPLEGEAATGRTALAQRLQDRLKQKQKKPAEGDGSSQPGGGTGSRRQQKPAADDTEERERRERLAAELLAEEEAEKAAKAGPGPAAGKAQKKRGKAAAAAAAAAGPDAAAMAPTATPAAAPQNTALPPSSSSAADASGSAQRLPPAEGGGRTAAVRSQSAGHSPPTDTRQRTAPATKEASSSGPEQQGVCAASSQPGTEGAEAAAGAAESRGAADRKGKGKQREPLLSAAAVAAGGQQVAAQQATPAAAPTPEIPQPTPAAATSHSEPAPPRSALPPWLSHIPASPPAVPGDGGSSSPSAPPPVPPASSDIPLFLRPSFAAAVAAPGAAPGPVRMAAPPRFQPPPSTQAHILHPSLPAAAAAAAPDALAALPAFLLSVSPAAVPAGAGRPTTTTETASADDDDNDCVVCLDAPRTHVLVPCGHVCACAKWCVTQQVQLPHCP